jgi:hypothetical protein
LDCEADVSATASGDHLAFGRIVLAHQPGLRVPKPPKATFSQAGQHSWRVQWKKTGASRDFDVAVPPGQGLHQHAIESSG